MRFKKIITIGLLIALNVIFSFASESSRAPVQLEIKGANISKEEEVKKIAKEAYFKKMNYQARADDGVRSVSAVKLAFDVAGFGKTGDNIWEIRIGTLNQELRAILWVHSETAKVYFLIGPWQDKPTKITSAEENKSGVKTNSNTVKP